MSKGSHEESAVDRRRRSAYRTVQAKDIDKLWEVPRLYATPYKTTFDEEWTALLLEIAQKPNLFDDRSIYPSKVKGESPREPQLGHWFMLRVALNECRVPFEGNGGLQKYLENLQSDPDLRRNNNNKGVYFKLQDIAPPSDTFYKNGIDNESPGSALDRNYWPFVIDFINAWGMVHKERYPGPLRTLGVVPDDFFEMSFSSVDDCRRALGIQHAPGAGIPRNSSDVPGLYFLPSGKDLSKPTGARGKKFDLLLNSLRNFSNDLNPTRLYILSGNPGDGKTTTMRNVFMHILGRRDVKHGLTYIPFNQIRTYEQVLSQMYQGIMCPTWGDVPDPMPDPNTMQSKIVNALANGAHAVIALDDCEMLADRYEGGVESAIKDESIFSLIEMILESGNANVKVIVGITTEADPRADPIVAELTALAPGKAHMLKSMPRLPLADGAQLIRKNPTAKKGFKVVEAFDAFLTNYNAGALDPPTLVTIALTTAFCLSDEMRKAAQTLGPRNNPVLCRAVWVAQSHDVQAAVTFLMDQCTEEQRLILRIIALLPGGCSYEDLSAYATSAISLHCPSGRLKHALGALQPNLILLASNGFAPAVRNDDEGDSEQDSNAPPSDYHLHTTLRRAIIRHWQSDKPNLCIFRTVNRLVAQNALREYRRVKSLSTTGPTVRVSELGPALAYFTHEMAGIDDKALEHEIMPDIGEDAVVELLEKKILPDDESVADRLSDTSNAERFAYLMRFFQDNIDEKRRYRLSRTYGADGMKVDLLQRAFYPGYYFPPGLSPLAGWPPSVPAHFPFSLNRYQTQVGKHVVEEAQPLIEACQRALAALESSRLVPESTISTESAGSALLRSEDVRGILALLQSAQDRNRLRVNWKVIDDLGLIAADRIANAALRMDQSSLFTSSNTLGERLADKLHDQRLEAKFKERRLKWRMRRGAIGPGAEAAAEDTRRNAEALLARLRASPTEAGGSGESDSSGSHALIGVDDAYGIVLRMKGFHCDCLAMQGDMGRAVPHYLALRHATAQEKKWYLELLLQPSDATWTLPVLLQGANVTATPAWSGARTRQFVRYGLRVLRLHDPVDALRLFPLSELHPETDKRDAAREPAPLLPDPMRLGLADLAALKVTVTKAITDESHTLKGEVAEYSDSMAAVQIEGSIVERFRGLHQAGLDVLADIGRAPDPTVFGVATHEAGAHDECVSSAQSPHQWRPLSLKFVAKANDAAWSGNVGPFTRTRMLLERVRSDWQWYLYGDWVVPLTGGDDEADQNKVPKEFASFTKLERIIGSCKSAELRLQWADALLLRAEIVQFFFVVNKVRSLTLSLATKEKVDLAGYLGRDAALRIEQWTNVADRVCRALEIEQRDDYFKADLEEAKRLINVTGYNMRRAELLLLEKGIGAVPCAYLVC